MRRIAVPPVILAMSMILWLTACNVTIHPGAIDKIDSTTYDVLITFNGALTQAKTMFAAGQLPASAKAIINDAGNSYNTLRDSWLGYRSATDAIKRRDYLDGINKTVPLAQKFIADLNTLILGVSGGKK